MRETITIAMILAAGEGKRMRSDKPKVLHLICGKPMLQWALESVGELAEEAPVVVIGHQGKEVQEYFGSGVRYAWQKEQKGTGHAVMMARSYLEGKIGKIVILAGDMPLLTQEQIKEIIPHRDPFLLIDED